MITTTLVLMAALAGDVPVVLPSIERPSLRQGISRKTAYIVMGSAHLADWMATESCIGHGCSEGNTWVPLIPMQRTYGRGIASVLGTVVTAEAVHAAGKRSPTVGKVTAVAVLAMKAIVVKQSVQFRIEWGQRRKSFGIQ